MLWSSCSAQLIIGSLKQSAKKALLFISFVHENVSTKMLVFTVMLYYETKFKPLRTKLKIPMEKDQIASSVKVYLLPYILNITNRQICYFLRPNLYSITFKL